MAPEWYSNGASPQFEFDELKSRRNRAKHGIDFFEAQALWLDEDLIRFPARSGEERRRVFIGLIAGKHWSAVTTYRREAIRLISVRRSRPKEVQLYEGQ